MKKNIISYLHPSLPLLLPRIRHRPEVLLVEGLIVGELHGRDEILAEQLKYDTTSITLRFGRH